MFDNCILLNNQFYRLLNHIYNNKHIDNDKHNNNNNTVDYNKLDMMYDIYQNAMNYNDNKYNNNH